MASQRFQQILTIDTLKWHSQIRFGITTQGPIPPMLGSVLNRHNSRTRCEVVAQDADFQGADFTNAVADFAQ